VYSQCFKIASSGVGGVTESTSRKLIPGTGSKGGEQGQISTTQKDRIKDVFQGRSKKKKQSDVSRNSSKNGTRVRKIRKADEEEGGLALKRGKAKRKRNIQKSKERDFPSPEERSR